jgi:hypothetical protein
VVNDLDFDEVNNKVWAIGTFFRQLIPYMNFVPDPVSVWSNSNIAATDAFVTAYTDGGTSGVQDLLWKGNIPNMGAHKMTGVSIAVNGSGNPFFTGEVDTAIVDPFELSTLGITGTQIFTMPGIKTAYMMGVDLPGVSGWSRTAIGYTANGTGVDVNANQAFFSGNFENDLTIQGNGGYPYVGGAGLTGESRVYKACYEQATGSGVWANVTISSTSLGGSHYANGIAVGTGGYTYTVGTYDEELGYFYASPPPTSGNLISSGSGYKLNAFIIRGSQVTGSMKIGEGTQNVIEESGGDSEMILFSAVPNPTTGMITLTIEGFRERDNYQLEIRGILGNVVDQRVLTTAVEEIDMTQLTSGLYLISIRGNNGSGLLRVVKTE